MVTRRSESIHAKRTLRIENAGTEASVNLENAQMCSLGLVDNGTNVMGTWGSSPLLNSEIIIFPVVGPAPDRERNVIHINGREFRLGQHGLLRDMKDFTIIDHGPDFVEFEYYYEAMREVERQASGGKPRILQSFPFPFNLRKRYSIDLEGILELRILLKNCHPEIEMPYMLGFHPAFRNVAGARLITDRISLSLEDVRNSDGNVMELPYESSIQYWNPEFSLLLRHTLGHMQIWGTEACTAIEPITGRAASKLGLDPNSDFRTLPNVRKLAANETDEFNVTISLLRRS